MAGEEQTFDQSYATSDEAVKAGLFDGLDDDEEIGGSEPDDEPEEVAADDERAPDEDASDDGGEADEADEGADDSDSDGDEETELHTLEDLAKAHELEAKDLDGLSIDLTIDGEDTTMTIGELREMAKTNRQANWTSAFQDLASRRRETDAKATELAEQQRQAADVNAQLLAEIERALLGDQRELQRLASERSPLYGQKHQAFMQRQERIEEIKRLVGMQREDADGRDSAARESRRRSETELLYLHHPELRHDQAAASKAMADVGKLMLDMGWSEDEIRSTIDHRLIRLAMRAAQGEGQTEKATAAIRAKLKKPAGKTSIKSRSSRNVSKANAARSARALDRLAKEGSEHAFAESLRLDGMA